MASLIETRQMVTDQMDQDRQKRNDWRRLTRKLSYASRHGKGTDSIAATQALIEAREQAEAAGYNSSGISRFSQNRAKAIEEIRQSMELSEERRKALQPMQDAGLMPQQGQQPALIPTGIPGRYTPSSVVGALKEQGGATAAAAEPEDTEPPVEEAPPLADRLLHTVPRRSRIVFNGVEQIQLPDGKFVPADDPLARGLQAMEQVQTQMQGSRSMRDIQAEWNQRFPNWQKDQEAKESASIMGRYLKAKEPGMTYQQVDDPVYDFEPNPGPNLERFTRTLDSIAFPYTQIRTPSVSRTPNAVGGAMTTAQFLQRKPQPGRFNILGAMSR